MQDVSDKDGQASDEPRERTALGNAISEGSGSPSRETSSSPPPRQSKAQPSSAPYGAIADDVGRNKIELPCPNVGGKRLWSPGHDSTLPRSSLDRSNITSPQPVISPQATEYDINIQPETVGRLLLCNLT